MSAIEHDCNKLTFQHNLDNNLGSKQSKVSMKLMSVKSLLHTEIAPVVDSTFLLCPWNWYSTTTVAPRFCLKYARHGVVLSSSVCLGGTRSRAAARTWQAHSIISTQ